MENIGCAPRKKLGRTSETDQHQVSCSKLLETSISTEQTIRTENVQFTEGTQSWVASVTSGPGGTFSQNDIEDANLGNFFSRPIKIFTTTWEINDSLTLGFDPWSAFFQNSRVSNRISNYNKLRADLHVKVVMTGSPFHFGKALMSYHPLHVYDDFEDIHFLGSDVPRLINWSQRPSIMLEAGGSAGGSMILPYVHFAQNLSIPAGEWQTMGRVNINSYTLLKHANGGTNPVEISIFVWATNVHLSVPTSAPPFGLTPQSGTMDSQVNDEYNGMVSGPAAIVAHMAGKLKNAPYIGKYAMATQTIANSVGAIARLFGFSRPIYPEQAEPTQVVPIPNTCNTNVHDAATKLTLDVKQETTIDPSVVGLPGTDEMSLMTFFQRESYITQFPWAVQAGAETILWSTLVTPIMMDNSDLDGQLAYRMTSLCYGSLPFHYWRGSLIYRFVVACSPYHKGKLTVRYEPRGFPDQAAPEYNVNYTHVLDIEESTDFEIKVGWTHTLPYLEFPKLDGELVQDAYPQPVWSTNNDHWDYAGAQFGNGILEISVQNCLGVPNTVVDNDVSILVFVRAADDYEVAGPDDTNIQLLSLLPQSGVVQEDANSGVGKPDESPLQLTVGSSGTPPDLLAIHDGDPVTSMRQCLKRYNLHNVYTFNYNDWAAIKWTRSDFPHYRGRTIVGIDVVSRSPDFPINSAPPVDTAYNVCKTTLLNYLTPGYVMRRGGLRRQYVFTNHENNKTMPLALVWREMRQQTENLDIKFLPSAVTSSFSLKQMILDWLPVSWSATASTLLDKNAVLTVELPYHNNRRAAPARRVNWKRPAIGLTSHTLAFVQRQDIASRPFILDYVSTAEDFQLMYYIGAPVFFLAGKTDEFSVVGRTI
jgi:hypothetical protein